MYLQFLMLFSGFFPFLALACWYHNGVEPYPPWRPEKGLAVIPLEVPGVNSEAESYFLNGMKRLHVYEFQEAQWAFRKAQALDPGFALAYWGELMTTQMLIWYAKDNHLSQCIIRKIHERLDVDSLPAKEKQLIQAAELLASVDDSGPSFGAHSAEWRFRHAMKALSEAYPDDLEILVWYGYAILGTRRGSWDNETNRLAADIFLGVLKKIPYHPGALHYLLHATENSELAYLSLPYLDSLTIAMPTAVHAIHMPTHHHISLGNWQSVIDRNTLAFEESVKRAETLMTGKDTLEFHGYSWIVYSHLQLGNDADAFNKLQYLYDLYREEETWTRRRYLLHCRSGFLVDAADRMLLDKAKEMKIGYGTGISSEVIGDIFAHLYLAWIQGDKATVAHLFGLLAERKGEKYCHLSPPCKDAIAIMYQQSHALLLDMEGKKDEALALLKLAAEMEVNMVHEHGIPLVVKPANELLAEILLAAFDYQGARAAIEVSQKIFPERRATRQVLQQIETNRLARAVRVK